MPSDFRWHSFLVSAGYLPDTEKLVEIKRNTDIKKVKIDYKFKNSV